MSGKDFPYFDNRELALLIWLFVLLVVLTVRKDTRQSLSGMLKTLLSRKLGTVLVVMVAYVVLEVAALSVAKIWTTDLIPTTVFWFFGPAVLAFARYEKTSNEPHFFRHSAVSSLTVTVTVAFLVNLYPLILLIEVLLVPVFVVIGGMIALAATRPEYKQVGTFVAAIASLSGIALLVYACVRAIADPQGFATLGNFREFVVPIMLMVLFLPFVYCVAVYATYDGLFPELRWRLGNDELARYAQRRLLRAAPFRLRTIQGWVATYPQRLDPQSNRSDIDRLVNDIRGSGNG